METCITTNAYLHCKIFLYSNKNNDSSRSHRNSMKHLSLSHQVAYVKSKKLSSVRWQCFLSI
jgi:hypothetical protein